MEHFLTNEKYQYMSVTTKCEVDDIIWMIDKRNCLYKSKGNEKFDLIGNLNCFSDGRDNQYEKTKILNVGNRLFFFPTCGECIIGYEIDNGTFFKIDTGSACELHCRAYILIDKYAYVFSTGRQRALLKIDLENLSCEIVPEFLESIKDYNIEENYFFSISVISDEKSVYIGVRGTNKILEYDLKKHSVQVKIDLPEEFSIEYIFKDKEDAFWVSEQSTGKLVRVKGDIIETITYNRDKVNSIIWEAVFSKEKAFFLPKEGNILMVYDYTKKEFEYIKIHTDLDDQYAEKLSHFLCSVELNEDILTIWLWEHGRVELNINTHVQTHFIMEKFPGFTYNDVIKKEQILPKQVKTTFYRESDMSLEAFLILLTLKKESKDEVK